MNPKRKLAKPVKLAREYFLAARCDAEMSNRSLLSSARRVMRARLKYDVGPLYYSLYRFSVVPEKDWSGYATDSGAFKQALRRASPAEAHWIARDKALFYKHCIQSGLPTIPVCCVIGVTAEQSKYEVPSVRTLDQWLSFVRSAPDEMFVKPINGSYGLGAFVIERKGEGFVYAGRSGSATDLFEYMKVQPKGEDGLLVQPRVRPSSEISSITSSSALSTVRAVTRMRNGMPELVIADLKITVGENIADNFAKATSGNLLAGIDRATGKLSQAWGSARKDWPVITAFPRHPDTGYPIEGFLLPFWDELVKLALKAQASLPQLRSVGWDIAATDRGLMLVEANNRYDLAILQIAHQRGLKQEFQDVIELQ
jgi:hypothetical protein